MELKVCSGCKKPIKQEDGRIKCTNQHTGETWYLHTKCYPDELCSSNRPVLQSQQVKRSSSNKEVWLVQRRDERGDDSDVIVFLGIGLNEDAADRIIKTDKAAGGGEWGSDYIKKPQQVKE